MRVPGALLGFALVGAAAIASAVAPTPSPVARPPISSPAPDPAAARAARWLWSVQGADGGWHSETYGMLRSGQSLTPFILLALLELPPEIAPPPPPGAVERALAFIRRHVDADGALGRADPLCLDYPNYATALAVRALARARPPGWEAEVAPLVAHLRRQQFAEDRGWTPDHPAHGAWGMGGPLRRYPHAGHLDVSMTRHVLQALAAAGVPASDPAFARAAIFLGRLQGEDGGFAFSTVVLDANKGGLDALGRPRPYGSATADGVLALRAIGAAPGDPRLERALAWLRERHDTRGVPGIDPGADGDHAWARALRLYYLDAAAEALAADAAPAIAAALLPRQRPDGSFLGDGSRMKEDDPLIATGLALGALGRRR